jgi:serine/threonine protein phosphatase 1
MRTFVMGDLHGAYGALLQCLQRSHFNYEEDTLIQLGDVTDRNSQVFECVEELLKIRNLVPIIGNHDAWFCSFLQTGQHPVHWKMGGLNTALSYLKHAGKEDGVGIAREGYTVDLSSDDIPVAHRLFFENMRLFHRDDDGNCFVHGGFDRNQPFLLQAAEEYFWNRSLWTQALSFEATQRGKKKPQQFKMATHFQEIFIGHTNVLSWDTDQPMHAANVWNIDTGAGHGAKLTIMDVDTHEFWQSDTIDKKK